jgi:hypothetical protein
MPENKNVVETHGCLVCARLFDLFVVYSPQGKLVDCAITSPEGQRVPDEKVPLVACVTHSAAEIEAAYKRWQTKNVREPDDEK